MLKQKSKLELLQDERKAIRILYKEEEKELFQDLNYLRSNWVSILFRTSIDGLKKNPSKPNNEENNLLGIFARSDNEKSESSNIFKQVGDIALTSLPFIWTIAQPLLIKYTVNKIKNKIFHKKK